MRLLYNMNPMPQLTSSFELSSMTHPFGFDCPAEFSLHIQQISIKVLTLGSSIKLNSMSHLIEEAILT